MTERPLPAPLERSPSPCLQIAIYHTIEGTHLLEGPIPTTNPDCTNQGKEQDISDNIDTTMKDMTQDLDTEPPLDRKYTQEAGYDSDYSEGASSPSPPLGQRDLEKVVFGALQTTVEGINLTRTALNYHQQ